MDISPAPEEAMFLTICRPGVRIIAACIKVCERKSTTLRQAGLSDVGGPSAFLTGPPTENATMATFKT
ncbi:hypothetical protein P3342_007662 [Pyrenophora teres f. teres]|nr:hypothetical protein P3342_007662 [Pyrenophora teres f. teres]